jgi:hypothetical protein
MPACPICGQRIDFLRPSEELKGLLTLLVLAILLGISLYQGPPADSFWRNLRIGVVALTFLPGSWWLFLYAAFWMKFRGADASIASCLAVMLLACGGQMLLLYLWVGRWIPSAA